MTGDAFSLSFVNHAGVNSKMCHLDQLGLYSSRYLRESMCANSPCKRMITLQKGLSVSKSCTCWNYSLPSNDENCSGDISHMYFALSQLVTREDTLPSSDGMDQSKSIICISNLYISFKVPVAIELCFHRYCGGPSIDTLLV